MHVFGLWVHARKLRTETPQLVHGVKPCEAMVLTTKEKLI